MKKVVCSLAFMLIGSFAFASSNPTISINKNAQIENLEIKISNFSELQKLLENESFSISDYKKTTNFENKLICGFWVSYDDGVTSFTQWQDCSDWDNDDLWILISFLLGY